MAKLLWIVILVGALADGLVMPQPAPPLLIDASPAPPLDATS